jgi:hypothetical protein
MATSEVVPTRYDGFASGLSSWAHRANGNDLSSASKAMPPRGPPQGTSGTAPTKEKIFCSYWIRNGCCDYAQQGCRYKHEMPSIETLRALNLARDYPAWYKAVNGMIGREDKGVWGQARLKQPSSINDLLEFDSKVSSISKQE